MTKAPAVIKTTNPSIPSDFFDPPEIPNAFKKAVGVVQVAMGKLGFLHRKIYNVMLANAHAGLSEGKTSFTIRTSDLAEMAGYNSHDFKQVYDACENLLDVDVQFFAFDFHGGEKKKRQRRRGLTRLLAGFSYSEGGVVTYSYAQEMCDLLSDPKQYIWMSLKVQNRFSSKYELNLFENCMRYLNVGSTGFKDVSEWRALLGAEDPSYDTFKSLNRSVIKPAVQGVNDKSGIIVSPEYQREKRKITKLKFSVTENLQMSLLDHQEHDRIRSTSVYSQATKFGLKDVEAIYWIETRGDAYVSDAVAYVEAKKAVKNPTGYLMRALREGFGEKSPEERIREETARQKAEAVKAKREAEERAETEARKVQTQFNEQRREKGRALIATLDAAARAELREKAKGVVPVYGRLRQRLEAVNGDIGQLSDSPNDKLIAGYIATEALKKWGQREDWDIQAYCEREMIPSEVRAFIR